MCNWLLQGARMCNLARTTYFHACCVRYYTNGRIKFFNRIFDRSSIIFFICVQTQDRSRTFVCFIARMPKERTNRKIDKLVTHYGTRFLNTSNTTITGDKTMNWSIKKRIQICFATALLESVEPLTRIHSLIIRTFVVWNSQMWQND